MYYDPRWTALDICRLPDLTNATARCLRLQRDYVAWLCRRAAHGVHERDVAGAKACRDGEIDLIEAGRGQSGEGRNDVHVVDAEAHGVSSGRRSRVYCARGHWRTGWSESDAEKLNAVARFCRNRRITKRGPRWADDVIGASAVSTGAVRPQDDARNVFRIEQVERRSKLGKCNGG